MTELVWAIKDSLVRYVRGAADGYIDLTDGASERQMGFVFPAQDHGTADARDKRPIAGLCFRGRVILTGHRGMLYLEFGEPAIEQGLHGPLLTIEDDAGERVPFAVLSHVPRPGEPAAARLTAEGADAMLGNYREGEELAPVALY